MASSSESSKFWSMEKKKLVIEYDDIDIYTTKILKLKKILCFCSLIFRLQAIIGEKV